MKENDELSCKEEKKIPYHSPLERKVSPWGATKVKVSPITADIRIINQ